MIILVIAHQLIQYNIVINNAFYNIVIVEGFSSVPFFFMNACQI